MQDSDLDLKGSFYEKLHFSYFVHHHGLTVSTVTTQKFVLWAVKKFHGMWFEANIKYVMLVYEDGCLYTTKMLLLM